MSKMNVKNFGFFFMIAAAVFSLSACNIQIGWNDYIDDKYIIDDENDGPAVFALPSVSINSPVNNQEFDPGTLSLSGVSVAGTYPLSAIYLSVNSGLYLSIGTSPVWNQSFYAEPGVYSFSVYAVDVKGNYSKTNHVTNIRIVGGEEQ